MKSRVAPTPAMTFTYAYAIVMPEPCYRCSAMTSPLAGLALDDADLGTVPIDIIDFSDGEWSFLTFDTVAASVAQSVPAAELARCSIGPIKLRTSRQRGSYLSNGCHACDAILGSHHIERSILEYLVHDGALADLVVARWEIDLRLSA